MNQIDPLPDPIRWHKPDPIYFEKSIRLGRVPKLDLFYDSDWI